MKTPKFAILVTALPLAGVALWSCNKDEAQQAPGASTAPQAQAPAASTAPQEQARNMPAAGRGMMQQMGAQCPMVVQGANVTVTDTDNGVAFTFTTQDGDVGDLRQRVQHMAQMYEMHRGHGAMMWHHMGRGGGMGRGGPGMGGQGPMPAASAKVTDIDKGARVELTPTDSSQLDALRQHVRGHQQRMQAGECWMLQNQPASQAPETQE